MAYTHPDSPYSPLKVSKAFIPPTKWAASLKPYSESLLTAPWGRVHYPWSSQPSFSSQDGLCAPAVVLMWSLSGMKDSDHCTDKGEYFHSIRKETNGSAVVKWRLAPCSAHQKILGSNAGTPHSFPLTHFWFFSKSWCPCPPSALIKWILSTAPAFTEVQAVMSDDCNSLFLGVFRNILSSWLLSWLFLPVTNCWSTLLSESCHKDTVP